MHEESSFQGQDSDLPYLSNDSNPYPLLENGMKGHVLLMGNK